MGIITAVLLISCVIVGNHRIDAFTTQKYRSNIMPSLSLPCLSMVKFDRSTQRWIPEDDEETPDAGYGLVGTLIRAGPLPFFQRVTNPDKYDQAVLKYMAGEGCDRIEAQGNMDAFFENPNDWQYQKMQEKNGAPKKDYANANTSPKEVALTGTWALIVVAWFTNFIIDCINGKYVKVG